jgi:hypothetical protein
MRAMLPARAASEHPLLADRRPYLQGRHLGNAAVGSMSSVGDVAALVERAERLEELSSVPLMGRW